MTIKELFSPLVAECLYQWQMNHAEHCGCTRAKLTGCQWPAPVALLDAMLYASNEFVLEHIPRFQRTRSVTKKPELIIEDNIVSNPGSDGIVMRWSSPVTKKGD